MKKILYARRLHGIHGFLKIADAGDDAIWDGEEIHFRVKKDLFFLARRAFGGDPSVEGRAMGLRIKSRQRQPPDFDAVTIMAGEDAVAISLWENLKAIAAVIDTRENLQDGFDVNCHTLIFEVLEAAGLDAPRDIYRKRAAEIAADERYRRRLPAPRLQP